MTASRYGPADLRKDWDDEQKARYAAESNLCPRCGCALCVKTRLAGNVVVCGSGCAGCGLKPVNALRGFWSSHAAMRHPETTKRPGLLCTAIQVQTRIFRPDPAALVLPL